MLVVYCVRKYKSKPPTQKNTLELNEEEFRENIEHVKKANDINLQEGRMTENKYVDFNEEEFIEGVPKR